jgi:hypothetical protein
MGSTREARHAGRKPADAATAIMADVAIAMVIGSVGLTPNSFAAISRVAASVTGTPIVRERGKS